MSKFGPKFVIKLILAVKSLVDFMVWPGQFGDRLLKYKMNWFVNICIPFDKTKSFFSECNIVFILIGDLRFHGEFSVRAIVQLF